MNFATTSNRLHRAFTLIEVLVVVALLSVIILGLVTMFSQTQRAYTLGMTQVDVLEGGRAVTELITREALQIKPSQVITSVNFFVQIPLYTTLKQNLEANTPAANRINVFEDLYYLTEENRTMFALVPIGTKVNGFTVQPTSTQHFRPGA